MHWSRRLQHGNQKDKNGQIDQAKRRREVRLQKEHGGKEDAPERGHGEVGCEVAIDGQVRGSRRDSLPELVIEAAPVRL